MALPQETDDHIFELIDYYLGLPVSAHTLEFELQSYGEKLRQLCLQYLYMKSQLQQKEEIIKRLRENNKDKETKARVHDLEQELMFYKFQISILVSKDDVTSTALSFFETNTEVEMCQKLQESWERLKPSTQKFVALASEARKLQKEKDILSTNICLTHDKVQHLCKLYKTLREKNRRLKNNISLKVEIAALVVVFLLCFVLGFLIKRVMQLH